MSIASAKTGFHALSTEQAEMAQTTGNYDVEVLVLMAI